MLYIIGLGLHDEQDLSLRALEILKNSDRVYAELYTSVFSANIEDIEKRIGKKIVILSRKDLEEKPEGDLFKDNKGRIISLLVPGDPMVATTHIDIILRARKLGIETKIIHSSSIYSAIAETGLQIYKFGKTTTLAFPEKSYFPTSPYDIIQENLKLGMHTLILLDIKSEEKRYMTVNDGIKILLEIEKQKKEKVFTEDTLCVGIARLGGDSSIRYGKARELLNFDFGKPPHVIVVPGKLHFMEEEALKRYS